jgi:predicted unusual protein kinase regulating ubiquinone biosynthesis (AarF/ABC1/UbiB family)
MFLVTVFLLFRRRQRLLWWRPLTPHQLLDNIRHLGTSFLKLAQVLATRADFFDANYVNALKQLHDQMPAMSVADRREVFASAFGEGHVFAWFDEEPLASASIGQVHCAELKDSGEKVAVKLLRKDIQFVVHCDIVLLKLFVVLFRPLFSDQTRHSIEAVLRAFAEVIVQEVSMTQELANLQHFRQVYADSPVRFPSPYPQYCSDQALVMSFEEGVRIDNVAAIKKLQIPFADLMHQLVLFYTEQMLVNGFFHADPHPGNLLVSPSGQLVLLDYGMVSRIPQRMRESMIYAVKASYERDFDLLISATKKMGILTEESDAQAMTAVAERLFDIFDSQHLDAISMQELALSILDMLHDQPFKLPQDVIYVMRVSSLLEGLGTQYIQNFNGVKDILPILKQNLPRALGEDRQLFERLAQEVKQLPLTLLNTRRVIQKAEQGELVVRMAAADRSYLLAHLKSYLRTLALIIFWLATAFYLQRSAGTWSPPLSWLCLGLAALTMIKFMRK